MAEPSFKKPRGFANPFAKRKKKATEIFATFGENVDEQGPVDTALTELTRKMNGDEKTAKRVLALQQQYPNGTVPELICMDWLDANKYRYIYQGQLYGGRATSGGLLPDFVVDTGGADGVAMQVQGDYWHAKRSVEKQFSDAEDNMRLLGQVVGGIKIGKVIGVWEGDLLRRRNQTMQYAVAGISLR